MGIRHPEAADRVTLEIELDQHDWFLAHDPTVMPRIDRHDLGSLVFHDTAVGVFDVDFAARQEADVGVHAQGSSDDRFHVDRPPESGWVHHALDAAPPACPTSSRTPPISRRSAPLTGAMSGSGVFDRRRTVWRVFVVAAFLTFFRAAFFFARCPQPA